MTILKNISLSTLLLNDIGFEIEPGDILDLNDVDITDVKDSTDISNAVTAGTIVFLAADGFTELTQAESEALDYVVDTSTIDLSNYYTIAQVQELINNMGSQSEYKDIIYLPPINTGYSYIKSGYKDHSGSEEFYDRLSVPYYVNNEVTIRQIISDVNGAGYLTGILLPMIATSAGTNRKVTIFITLDGVETSEEFTFSNIFDASYRLFLGSANSSFLNTEKSSGDLTLTNSDTNDDVLVSNRKPQKTGIANKTSGIIIPHPGVFLNDLHRPRIPFKTSLKVEYQLNQTDMYTSSAYKNRSVAFYILGDF